MSMTKLGLTPGPLVCTLFALFFFVLKSPLLVFWGLTPGPLVCNIFALLLYMLKSLLLVFLRLIFSPSGVDSVAGAFESDVFASTGVESKGG